MNIVNERINQAIKRSGLSYGELAKITGIPKSALQRYATGATLNIPLDRIWAIADATHVESGWLVNWLELDNKYESLRIVEPDEQQLLYFYRLAQQRYKDLAMDLLKEHPDMDILVGDDEEDEWFDEDPEEGEEEGPAAVRQHPRPRARRKKT